MEVRIAPLLGRTYIYDLPEDVNDEISTVTKILVDSAVDTLPVRRDSGTKPRINDPHLKNLCIYRIQEAMEYLESCWSSKLWPAVPGEK